MKFPESALAHRYLDGLTGIEIGGSAHNGFGLKTLNVDCSASMDTDFKKSEIELCGEAMKVDIVANGDELPFKDAAFDFVVSSHVLEHFTDPIKALKEWYRVVRREGYIFMIVPHKERTFDKNRERTTLSELILRHEVKKYPKCDPNGHLSVWITEDIVELVRYLDWRIVRTQDKDDKVGNGFTIVIKKINYPSKSHYRRYFGVDRWITPLFFKKLIQYHASIVKSLFIIRIKSVIGKIRAHGFIYAINNIKDKIIWQQSYRLWLRRSKLCDKDLLKQTLDNFQMRPRISIVVPVYQTKKSFLHAMIASVMKQTYSNWELCLADGSNTNDITWSILRAYSLKDSRIKAMRLTKNMGIAGNSNMALSLATGDFVALLDHDDILPPFALYEVIKAINDEPEADFIYSDEDKVSFDGSKRFDPHFKPNWSPDTIRSLNYITHLTVIRKDLLDRVGYFREGYDGSQDYDLILRATEKANKIIHIAKILYHWRTSKTSTSRDPNAKPYAYESAKKALSDHLKRKNMQGTVQEGLFRGSYRVQYKLEGYPKVSIIVAHCGPKEPLIRCIDSLLRKSSYKNYEILIVKNGVYYDPLLLNHNIFEKTKNIHIVEFKPNFKHNFNFSSAINHAVNSATGKILLFLHDDTEIITEDFLDDMLQHAIRKDVGAVGAKLYYPDNTIQSAGIVMGTKGDINHIHRNYSRYSSGYMGRLSIIQNVGAVSSACMMMRKEVFEQVGAFDINLKLMHVLRDVDLCMKLKEKGYLIIFSPYTELFHFEPKNDACEHTSAVPTEVGNEVNHFKTKWKDLLIKGDRYYNENLPLNRRTFYLEKNKNAKNKPHNC